MTWTVRPVAPHEVDDVRRLLLANGWTGSRFEPERFAAICRGSHASLVALDRDRIVGFGRAVADGLSNGYLCNLVVDEAYRKRGVATALVERLLGDDPDQTWVLRAERPGLAAFYEKLGFRLSTVTMERVRSSPG